MAAVSTPLHHAKQSFTVDSVMEHMEKGTRRDGRKDVGIRKLKYHLKTLSVRSRAALAVIRPRRLICCECFGGKLVAQESR